MTDYERIARVIRYLDEHQAEQPSLEDLAERAGVSAFHFHRLFHAWAGVTPKVFLQCLTLEHAKRLLAEGRSVLDAALDAGLSGPGRLHDLCLKLESATPGELKFAGQHWTLEAGFATCPFGECLIGVSPRGICHLSFVEPGDETAAWSQLRAQWPNASLLRQDWRASEWASEIFASPGASADRPVPLRAWVTGTAFQVRVWRALLRIPPGAVTTYRRLAVALGVPGGARAVGSAVGRNPLAYLIPCHRVIRETGLAGEYRWGSVRKRVLLGWEAAGSLGTGNRLQEEIAAG
jgi:AraC family transcriptional regulator of adaptative response/methylated-DNA-[protein]-cysteine methyltransferase